MINESFFSFIKNLFNNDFMPHGHCYFWRPDIVWLHVLSDGFIALSYYAIPLILLVFMYKRKDFPFPWVLAMFGAFIVLCGTTHIMDVVTIWNPLYRLDGVIRAATAIISVITTIVLIPLIPLALALKSPKELEAANLKLAEANNQLKEIDRLKDTFFSNISHELRTPLTLILAPIESFLANDYGPLSEAQRKNMRVMHNNSIRLFQMINSILDFAKISAKKIEVKREPIDIVALTKSIVQEFDPIVKQKHIKLTFNCDDAKKWVSLDRYLYERILFNLLSNAAKFTPDQGSISVSLILRDEKLILSVTDTGIGISELNQKKLFQRFQQVEGSATRRFEGTGLGLSLVKEFSLLLNGDVRVESEIDKGSQFIIEISAPEVIVDETKIIDKTLEGHFQKFNIAAIEEEQPKQTKTNNKKAKILVAEDNIELASYVTSLLSDFAQVKHAPNGKLAEEILKTWNPDLALLDVMMPEKDGITLCREIKSSTKTAHISVVLLTALTHRDALTRGWEAGADEYLFKPFHPKELVTRIKLLLENSINNKLLKELNKELITAARLAGRSEMATGILHNVGNVLNTVNVAVEVLLERLSKSKAYELKKLGQWVKENLDNPSEFVNNKEKQANLISYLNILCDTLLSEQSSNIDEVQLLNKNVKIINDIISIQQTMNNPTGVVETVNLAKLVEDAILIGLNKTEHIQIIKNFSVFEITLDKTRLHQILVNLIRNAKEALLESQEEHKKITISIQKILEDHNEWIIIEVKDNGSGITEENLRKIFNFGFTTKTKGNGFGLHISAISAQEMGGTLEASSPGKNCGASFILKLPTEPFDIKKWVEI